MTDGGIVAMAKVYGAAYAASYEAYNDEAYNDESQAREEARAAVKDFVELIGEMEKD